MKRKKQNAEQIKKLRGADTMLAGGKNDRPGLSGIGDQRTDVSPPA